MRRRRDRHHTYVFRKTGAKWQSGRPICLRVQENKVLWKTQRCEERERPPNADTEDHEVQTREREAASGYSGVWKVTRRSGGLPSQRLRSHHFRSKGTYSGDGGWDEKKRGGEGKRGRVLKSLLHRVSKVCLIREIKAAGKDLALEPTKLN